MEGVSSPSMEQVGTKSFFSPLLISMLGVIVTTMAILAYHLILVKYCMRRYAANAAAAQPPAAPRPPTGVDEKILEAIPILAFLAVKRGNDQGECVVCLGALEDEDAVRLLPNCNHAFHVSCIDQWFLAHASCPLCRSPVLRQQADAAPAALDLVEDPNNGGGSGDTNDNGESPWRGQSIGLVRSCSSVETTTMDEISGWRLKRSLSIDLSVVVIDLERANANCPRTTSFSFSSSSRGIMRSGSLSHFDRVPSKWLRSFSWLRPPGKPSSTTPILPY